MTIFLELPEGQTTHDPIEEVAERITIDYANLSGRESANRAEFRERVIQHFRKYHPKIEDKISEFGKQQVITKDNL